MVKIPGLPEEPAKGVRNLRPAIDYGRCCWCALSVDLCPIRLDFVTTRVRAHLH